ncbi:hypothetical protein ACJX0J_018516, partial [Zea mays]
QVNASINYILYYSHALTTFPPSYLEQHLREHIISEEEGIIGRICLPMDIKKSYAMQSYFLPSLVLFLIYESTINLNFYTEDLIGAWDIYSLQISLLLGFSIFILLFSFSFLYRMLNIMFARCCDIGV